MIERNASDLHLAAGVPPVFRVNGALITVRKPTPPVDIIEASRLGGYVGTLPEEVPNLTPEALDALLQTALPADKLTGARQGRDFSVTLRHAGHTFRCRVFRERGRLATAVRILPDRYSFSLRPAPAAGL